MCPQLAGFNEAAHRARRDIENFRSLIDGAQLGDRPNVRDAADMRRPFFSLGVSSDESSCADVFVDRTAVPDAIGAFVTVVKLPLNSTSADRGVCLRNSLYRLY